MGLGKLGVGTLILTGTNTYTGNTSISGGTLEIGGATGQLAGGAYAGAIAITAGTLRFNTAASQTLSGPITQTGSLVKDGAGILTLTSAASSGSGSTTVNAGTLRIENSVNALRGNVALGAAGTLVLSAPVSGGLIAYNNTVSGSGLLRITGMTSFGRVLFEVFVLAATWPCIPAVSRRWRGLRWSCIEARTLRRGGGGGNSALARQAGKETVPLRFQPVLPRAVPPMSSTATGANGSGGGFPPQSSLARLRPGDWPALCPRPCARRGQSPLPPLYGVLFQKSKLA